MRASVLRPGRHLFVAGVLLAASAFGCTPYRPPGGWLEAPVPAQAEVYGAWIRLRFDGHRPDVDGELLAVESDSVYVLGMDSVVDAVGLGAVEKAELYVYDPDLTGGQVWSLLGMLGTLSNGYYSSFTLPLWSIAGGIGFSSDRRAAAPRVGKRSKWAEARPYARFPQGLPPGLPRHLAPRTLGKKGG